MIRFWRSVAALSFLCSVLAVGALETVGPVTPVSAAGTVEGGGTIDVDGFTVTRVLNIDVDTPVGVEFAPDGRIFVSIKDGRVIMYDGPGDSTYVTTLDIQDRVMSFHDRGMLGLAIDPDFSNGRPYIYVLYTYDRDPFNANQPTHPTDECPPAPAGCTASGRLDRYSVDSAGVGTFMNTVLDGAAAGQFGGWCNEFDSHSIGTAAFGADGALYVGAGDGGSFNYADHGQSEPNATTPNPCDDRQGTIPRSGGRGTPLTAPTSRGGSLRSQAVRGALPDDYISWDGAILRVDPDTGAAAAGNPLLTNGIKGDDRIVAYGLRNPFRFNFKPGTNELWLGDVGWSTYEEIDTFTSGPNQTSVPNFGWPCYEGPNRVPEHDSLDTNLCEMLYDEPDSSLDGVPSPLKEPVYAWTSRGQPGQLPCAAAADGGGGSVTGGQFATNSQWPAAQRGAYIFADYARKCIAYMPVDANGVAQRGSVASLISGVFPVSIENGPGGDIYYLDIKDYALNRIRPNIGNFPPVASFTATPSSGPLPLTVTFDASGTTDSNPGQDLTYSWDLDGDGACGDAEGIVIVEEYTTAAKIDVKLCVSDSLNATASTIVQIQPGNSAPVITSFTTSADGVGWKVGDLITFAAQATDTADDPGPLTYTWSLQQRHCETETGTVCHTHLVSTPPAGNTGSFTAADHEYFAFLQLTLAVTDPRGLTTTLTRDIKPRVSTITLQSSVGGINVSNGGSSGVSPVATKYLENGSAQLTVPATASVGGSLATFIRWNDGNTSKTRTVTAAPGSSTYTAIYDGGPPSISNVVATPAFLDLRSGNTVTVTANIADDIGVASAVATITNGSNVHQAGMTRTSGSSVSGAWSAIITVPSDAPLGSYTASVGAIDGTGKSSNVNGPAVALTRLEPPVPGTGFATIVPQRMLDTRNGTGAPAAAATANTVMRLQVTGTPGIPDNAEGVVVNVTAVDSRAAGYVTVFPCGADVPVVSTLNMQSGETVANLAIVRFDSTGGICLLASQDTDLVADATAVVVPDGVGYQGISPVRVVDTREALGVGTALTPSNTVQLPLGDAVMPSDATGVVANVTVTNPDSAGYVTVFPCASGAPLASNVNFVRGQTVSNLVLVDLDPGQLLCATTNATLDLVVDVSGWLKPDAGEPRLVAPYRRLDTRTTVRLTTGQTVELTADQLGVADDATAIVANVTAVDTAAPGYVTVAPCEAGTPTVSNVNFSAADTRPVLTITTLGASRTICVRTSQPLDVVVDIQGWFVPG